MLFFLFFPFEVVVVDGPVQAEDEVGVGESHQPVVFFPFGAIDADALFVVAVRVEGHIEGDVKLFEKGGSSRDGERRPTERVGGDVSITPAFAAFIGLTVNRRNYYGKTKIL